MQTTTQNISLYQLAIALGEKLLSKKFKLVTAESCTGGGIACAITAVPGSSGWLERGFVTYSNEAKQEMLGVNAVTLANFGAVSQETAIAMAEGALRHSHADISLSTTGIAGPSGGTIEKPIGLVWFAIAGKNFATVSFSEIFAGDRGEVRALATQFALQQLLEKLVF